MKLLKVVYIVLAKKNTSHACVRNSFFFAPLTIIASYSNSNPPPPPPHIQLLMYSGGGTISKNHYGVQLEPLIVGTSHFVVY